jgi:hypothetical protein
MLAFLAINSTYRGPYTPGSATCLAFLLAVPDDTSAMMTKLEGGIGALCEDRYTNCSSRVAARSGTAPRPKDSGRRRSRDGSEISTPVGPNRPGLKGFLDMPIPIDGLWLGGAGITFIPGYNVDHQVLENAGVSQETSRTR